MLLKNDIRSWLTLTGGVAFLVRLGLWLVYPFTQNSDSPGYLQLAHNLIYKSFHLYSPYRTPVYPAFLAITGLGAYSYLAQLALGLITSLLLFYIGYQLTQSPRFAAFIGLAHALNPSQFFFEASMLTESITIFLLALALAGLLYLLKKPTLWLALLISLITALAGLARPLFVFVPVLFAVYLFINFPRRWVLALAISLPALILFGAWVNFVQEKTKITSFDTLGGYRMLNHVGGYIEYAPAEYDEIKQIYIRYRTQRIAETGAQNNTIWGAIPELQKATGLNYNSLSRLLGGMAWQTIQAQPLFYLQTVADGWLNGWLAAVYYEPNNLIYPALQPFVRMWVLISRGGILLANFIFIFMSFFLAGSPAARSRFLAPFPLMLLGLVWAASIVQSLFDYGDNQRYLVPVQSLVLLLVFWWGKKAFEMKQVKEIN